MYKAGSGSIYSKSDQSWLPPYRQSKAMPRVHIHLLILGGDDKGVDMTPLFISMQSLNLTLYTIGANSDKLLTLAKTYNINAVESQTIQNAVKQIDEVHTQESVALLSPAAASFDQFKSYKHRGETFMELVKELKK